MNTDSPEDEKAVLFYNALLSITGGDVMAFGRFFAAHVQSLALPLLICGVVAGCSPNTAYRTQSPTQQCPTAGCQAAVLEQHAAYDLGFVEFTDQGNVFNRAHMDTVLNHIEQHNRDNNGAAVVVFIHGWHHNANPQDENLQGFRQLLERTAQLGITGKRRLIGVYVGWRGQTIDVPLAEHLSFWARKNTAHNVGRGGVTELMLRIERSAAQANTPQHPNHNLLVALGHSFGGLVLISSLNDVLLERVIDAKPLGHQACAADNAQQCGTCVQTDTFGHGIILLNPAIEANELLQLKEVVAAQQCYAKTQPKLLHVISSEADSATNIAFRAGQFLGVSVRSSELPLQRTYKGKTITLHERDLDTTTIGNYLPFRTGVSLGNRARHPACQTGDKREECYIPCKDDARCLVREADKAQHIPVGTSEPLHFLYTDANFIKDHNDVFNADVGGYIVATVMESSFKRLSNPRNATEIPLQCHKADEDFDFPRCFDYYKAQFEQSPALRAATPKPRTEPSPR